MSQLENNIFRMIFCSFFVIAVVGTIYLVSTMAVPKGEYVKTITSKKVTVTSVTNCNAGKHSYRCDVRVDNAHVRRLNLAKFPGDMIQVGDVIFNQTKVWEGQYKTYACKNNMCRNNSVCTYTMPCFKDFR